MRTSTSVKLARIESKRKKVELEIKRDEARDRLAAEERAMVLQLESKEQIARMQCELELARLKAGQPSGAASAHPVGVAGGDNLVGAYPPDLSQQHLFATGGNATTSTAYLPPLPPPF